MDNAIFDPVNRPTKWLRHIEKPPEHFIRSWNCAKYYRNWLTHFERANREVKLYSLLLTNTQIYHLGITNME